ncbi:hypothetical protein DFP81_1131, partial [Marinomonas pollencensis]
MLAVPLSLVSVTILIKGGYLPDYPARSGFKFRGHA